VYIACSFRFTSLYVTVAIASMSMRVRSDEPIFEDHETSPFDDDNIGGRTLRELAICRSLTHSLVFAGLPSGNEVEDMHRAIFGSMDDEDGFEKALSTLQALRGIDYIVNISPYMINFDTIYSISCRKIERSA
jgi:hypothetical protein